MYLCSCYKDSCHCFVKLSQDSWPHVTGQSLCKLPMRPYKSFTQLLACKFMRHSLVSVVAAMLHYCCLQLMLQLQVAIQHIKGSAHQGMHNYLVGITHYRLKSSTMIVHVSVGAQAQQVIVATATNTVFAMSIRAVLGGRRVKAAQCYLCGYRSCMSWQVAAYTRTTCQTKQCMRLTTQQEQAKLGTCTIHVGIELQELVG